MYPGTRAPFYGGMQRPGMMGPRQMGPMPRQMGPMNQGMMRPMGQAQYNMGPMVGHSQPTARQGGGILSRLLGQGTQRGGAGMPNLNLGNAAASTTRASGGGGVLQTLTNPGAINGFLNNTQQALKAAQSFGPMIQQYGPMVRNLPSMWKLYRGLKDLPNHDESSVEPKTETKTSPITSTTIAKEKRPIGTKATKKKTTSAPAVKKTVKFELKESKPKLFY